MRSEAAEAIGTFALVVAACGAIAVNSVTGAIGHVGIAIAFGLVIGAMIYTLGHISGAHFNPAVTLAFAATHHFPWRRVPGYIAAQCGGATAGALLLRWLMPEADVGVTRVADFLTTPAGFIIEVLLTTILMLVIASVATDGRAVGHMAGLAIGSTVALSAMWAGPLTNASMNPARSLGPAIAQPELAGLWLFLLAPVIGALLGAFLYEAIRKADTPRKVPA